ncbi:MAG: hypothetical protein ACYC5M_13780 [Anaerolineae bacterium]
MKLFIYDQEFYLDTFKTYTAGSGFPDADPILAGLVLNHRVVNGIFDDLGPCTDYDADGREDWAFQGTGRWDPELNTDRFVKAMRWWREQGVIGFTIGLQGDNPRPGTSDEVRLVEAGADSSAFEPDGSLRPAFMGRLRRILDAARELDMVPIVNYFTLWGIARIQEQAIGDAVDNATRWLLENGFDRLLIEVAHECDAEGYPAPLGLPRVHEMVYRVKDCVDLYNDRTGQERRFYVGCSLSGAYLLPEAAATLPETFMRSVDVLFPHGDGRTTEEFRAGLQALRERARVAARKPLPIVCNRDVRLPTGEEPDCGGDLEHLEMCLEEHVSWGNMIRCHQRVPCEDWVGGTLVQREWFSRTSKLAGKPKPPSSVLKHYYRI